MFSFVISFQGLDFLDVVWKWGSEEIKQICHEWLKLLLNLIRLAEMGAGKLLRDIFESRTDVVKEYKPFIADQV